MKGVSYLLASSLPIPLPHRALSSDIIWIIFQTQRSIFKKLISYLPNLHHFALFLLLFPAVFFTAAIFLVSSFDLALELNFAGADRGGD